MLRPATCLENSELPAESEYSSSSTYTGDSNACLWPRRLLRLPRRRRVPQLAQIRVARARVIVLLPGYRGTTVRQGRRRGGGARSRRSTCRYCTPRSPRRRRTLSMSESVEAFPSAAPSGKDARGRWPLLNFSCGSMPRPLLNTARPPHYRPLPGDRLRGQALLVECDEHGPAITAAALPIPPCCRRSGTCRLCGRSPWLKRSHIRR